MSVELDERRADVLRRLPPAAGATARVLAVGGSRALVAALHAGCRPVRTRVERCERGRE